MPGKMLSGGGNNAKANEWTFAGEEDLSVLFIGNSLFLTIG